MLCAQYYPRLCDPYTCGVWYTHAIRPRRKEKNILSFCLFCLCVEFRAKFFSTKTAKRQNVLPMLRVNTRCPFNLDMVEQNGECARFPKIHQFFTIFVQITWIAPKYSIAISNVSKIIQNTKANWPTKTPELFDMKMSNNDKLRKPLVFRLFENNLSNIHCLHFLRWNFWNDYSLPIHTYVKRTNLSISVVPR